MSRGFRCGPAQKRWTLSVTVPADFPCYYDVLDKDYALHDYASTLSQLRKYLEGALTLARTGGAYRTDAEYKPLARAPAVPAPRRSGARACTGCTA